MDFSPAEILAARATKFAGPVVRTVIKISRTTKWRQDTGKVEARHRLLPINPDARREEFFGQTVIDLLHAQCVDAGLPPVADEAVLAALLIAEAEHERKLAKLALERKSMREAGKVLEAVA